MIFSPTQVWCKSVEPFLRYSAKPLENLQFFSCRIGWRYKINMTWRHQKFMSICKDFFPWHILTNFHCHLTWNSQVKRGGRGILIGKKPSPIGSKDFYPSHIPTKFHHHLIWNSSVSEENNEKGATLIIVLNVTKFDEDRLNRVKNPQESQIGLRILRLWIISSMHIFKLLFNNMLIVEQFASLLITTSFLKFLSFLQSLMHHHQIRTLSTFCQTFSWRYFGALYHPTNGMEILKRLHFNTGYQREVQIISLVSRLISWHLPLIDNSTELADLR